jgi:hypothetical protein
MFMHKVHFVLSGNEGEAFDGDLCAGVSALRSGQVDDGTSSTGGWVKGA